MADADKVDSSTSKTKSKTSFLDEDISEDFLSSWKSMSATGGDDMDFNFEPVAKGKKKAFDFGMDMDFSLDDAFGKMPSFKLDMPDIDFSSSPKKSSKSKDKTAEGESDKGSHLEKNEKFTFTFDFNGDGDNKDNGEIRTKMVADALPHDGQAKKHVDLLDDKKTSVSVKSSGADPSNDGNGQLLHDNPSSYDKELMKQDSTVEKRENNADVSRDGDNIENGEIRTKMAIHSVPRNGQAEVDKLHLLDNRKMSIDIKSSRDKESSFVEIFGKLPELKSDVLQKSAKFKENLSEESAKGNHQEKSNKLTPPTRYTEETNTVPTSKEVEVVGSLDTDNIPLDDVDCFTTNPSKTMNSENASNPETQRSGLKDSPLPSDCEPTHAKPIPSRYQVSGANNISMVRGTNKRAEPKLLIEGKNKGSIPLVATDLSDDPSSELGRKKMDDNSSLCGKELIKRQSNVKKMENNANVSRDGDNNEDEEIRINMVAHPVPSDGHIKKDGLRLLDNSKMSINNKSSGNRLPSLVTPKGMSISSNQENEKLKAKISTKSTVQQSNAGQVNRLPTGRIDKIMPSLTSLRISSHRNITPNKQSSSSNVQDPNSVGNPEKSPKLQVKSRMVSPVNVQKQTPSMPSLKRKPAEAADLHQSKRPSPSDSRKSEVSAKEVLNEVQTQGILVEGSKNLSPKFDSCLEANAENLGFTLMLEGDVNVEKAEACAKELEEICSMLKKKHDEAKELLVRALINNNNLLMLNYPMCEQKIRDVHRFASRLMSREQVAGVYNLE